MTLLLATTPLALYISCCKKNKQHAATNVHQNDDNEVCYGEIRYPQKLKTDIPIILNVLIKLSIVTLVQKAPTTKIQKSKLYNKNLYILQFWFETKLVISINPSYHLKASLLAEANYHVPANAKFTSPQNYTSTEADKSRTNVYKFSFSPHTVPEWNDLTSDQVSAMNLEQFKTYILR